VKEKNKEKEISNFVSSLGNVGNYWLTYTRFDPSFNFGILGQYGGTTAQFIANYKSYAGKAPDVQDAVSRFLLIGGILYIVFKTPNKKKRKEKKSGQYGALR
jgi:hypothetical protein